MARNGAARLAVLETMPVSGLPVDPPIMGLVAAAAAVLMGVTAGPVGPLEAVLLVAALLVEVEVQV